MGKVDSEKKVQPKNNWQGHKAHNKDTPIRNIPQMKKKPVKKSVIAGNAEARKSIATGEVLSFVILNLKNYQESDIKSGLGCGGGASKVLFL